jgi:hypothetical protein
MNLLINPLLKRGANGMLQNQVAYARARPLSKDTQ